MYLTLTSFSCSQGIIYYRGLRRLLRTKPASDCPHSIFHHKRHISRPRPISTHTPNTMRSTHHHHALLLCFLVVVMQLCSLACSAVCSSTPALLFVHHHPSSSLPTTTTFTRRRTHDAAHPATSPSSSRILLPATSLQAIVQSQYEEVSASTFPGVLERIRAMGKEAAFFALDTEFTGYKQSERDEYFDTVQQRYVKKKEVAEKYLVVQMGLSAFVWDEGLNDFRAYTWNINLFPSPQVERLFACDAGSLTFLRSHSLDFNAWVDGVPFLALEQEATLHKQIEDTADWDLRATTGGKKPTRSPLDPNADPDTIALHHSLNADLDSLGPQSATPILLPEGMPWYRKKMVEATVSRHPRKINLWLEEIDVLMEKGEGEDENSAAVTATASGDLAAAPAAAKKEKQKRLQVRYVTAEQRQQVVTAKKDQALAALEQSAGAMRILEVLKESGRPLVGHNFLLDLLFLYSHFVKPTLPETAMGFKTKVARLFPRIYDTKVLAKGLEVYDDQGDTNLEGLFRSVSEGVSEGGVENGDGAGNGAAAAHEAGHDAFMTGVVFASLLRRAKAKSLSLSEESASATTSGGLASLAYAEEYVDKIFMRTTDVETLELANFKQIPDRSHVFYVRTLPQQPQGNAAAAAPPSSPMLNHNELRDIFSPLGPLFIRTLGKHEAYIALQRGGDKSKPLPELAALREMITSRGRDGGKHLEIVSYEERRVALGIQW